MDPGLAVVLDRHLAVDEDEAITLRALDAPPLAAGEIVRDLRRQAGELLEVVDDDVRRRTFDGRRLRREAVEHDGPPDRDRHDTRVVPAEPRAPPGVGELLLALRDGADRRLDPGRVVVEEVPVLEREGEGGGGGDALAVHPDAALPAGIEPADEAAMRLRKPDERLDDVVQDRPADT